MNVNYSGTKNGYLILTSFQSSPSAGNVKLTTQPFFSQSPLEIEAESDGNDVTVSGSYGQMSADLNIRPNQPRGGDMEHDFDFEIKSTENETYFIRGNALTTEDYVTVNIDGIHEDLPAVFKLYVDKEKTQSETKWGTAWSRSTIRKLPEEDENDFSLTFRSGQAQHFPNIFNNFTSVNLKFGKNNIYRNGIFLGL